MPLRIGSEMPSLDGATGWFHGDPRPHLPGGAPTLIHFWSLSCYLCKNNLPVLKGWKETYGPRGLRFIAVHLPRAEDETDTDKVNEALALYQLDEPCAIDNEHAIAAAFQNDQIWVPYYFLFDSDGIMKSRGAGEAAAGVLDGALKRLFATDGTGSESS